MHSTHKNFYYVSWANEMGRKMFICLYLIFCGSLANSEDVGVSIDVYVCMYECM